MRIKSEYKVREMAGEHVVVMQGRYGADMTRVVALNESAVYLWGELAGRDFLADEPARLLSEHYGIGIESARKDAAAWIEKLAECGLLER